MSDCQVNLGGPVFKEEKVPPSPRIFHVNSMGEFSIRPDEDPKDKGYNWVTPKESDLTEEEKKILATSNLFREQLHSAEFRVYAGNGQWRLNGPPGFWMTLENEFVWGKKEASVVWPAVEAYAKKFNAILEEMGRDEGEGRDFHYCLMVDIRHHTIGDAIRLKRKMLSEIRSKEALLENILGVL